MPSESPRRPCSRPRRGLALVVSAATLAGASSCWVDSEALKARPRDGHVASPSSEPASAGASLPSRGDDGAPRGPRRGLPSLSRTEVWAAWNSLRGDAYALDPIERIIDTGARIECNPEALVSHRGSLLPYRGAVRVDPAFRERLIRFEQIVLDVATDVYGRAPARLRHFGAYVCRATRHRSQRMSEHALGNAIDIVGFEFARAKKQDALAEGLPRTLRGPFQIRVARHWSAPADDPVAAVHARCLRELAARLSDRSDVFRGMIGPSRRDHADHFHFDMSPWRYVYF